MVKRPRNTPPTGGQHRTGSVRPREMGFSRRRFLAGTAAAGSFIVVPSSVFGAGGQTPASERVNVAGIGIGGVGASFLRSSADRPDVNISALCDVDERHAAHVFETYPKAKRYRDYREMLDAEKGIDGVIVATPDHSHAVICMRAIKLGKPVCCVKPLTRTVDESRKLAAAARQAGVATQVTAASSVSEGALKLRELIQSGAIGDVREVHCWSNRPVWPQGMTRPEGEDPIPAHLDWDLWIGPAPMRPFKDVWPDGHLALQQVHIAWGSDVPFKAVYHPWNFRGWWDFGTGSLGDMGCHYFNTIAAVLKLGYPAAVHATSTKLFPETVPLASIVTWDFPARADMPPVRLFWYDGGLKPPRPAELEHDRLLGGEGVLYIGEKGKILGGIADGRVIPESRMQTIKEPPKTLPRLAHKNPVTDEWVTAIKGGPAPSCNFDVGALIAEIALLGNVAIRTGKLLEYDGAAMKFTGDADANKYLSEPYRSGWSL